MLSIDLIKNNIYTGKIILYDIRTNIIEYKYILDLLHKLLNCNNFYNNNFNN